MQAAYSNTKVVAFLREPGRNIWFLPRNESFHCFGVPGFYLQENFELILIKTKHKSHYSGELGSLAGVDAVMHSRDGTARTQEEMSTGMIFACNTNTCSQQNYSASACKLGRLICSSLKASLTTLLSTNSWQRPMINTKTLLETLEVFWSPTGMDRNLASLYVLLITCSPCLLGRVLLGSTVTGLG